MSRQMGALERVLLLLIIAIPCTLPVTVVNVYLQGACALPSWFAFILLWSCFTMGYVYAAAIYHAGIWEGD